MNVIARYETDRPIQELVPETGGNENEIAAIVGIIRRQLPVILTLIVLGLVGAGLYLFTATRWYTATAEVIMETRRNFVLRQDPFMEDGPIDTGLVESHVATIKSERVSKAVIKALKLTEDPEFTQPSYGPFTEIILAARKFLEIPGEAPSAEDVLLSVQDAFRSRLSVRRVQGTYVIQIAFVALSPEKAARITNQIADAYISDQLQSKFEATERAEAWLSERVNELRDESSQAEKRVLEFKLANNIMTADGRPVDEKRISDYDQRLNEARAKTADAQARLARLTAIIDSGQVDAAVTDSMTNSIIMQLRQRYLEAAARAADWSKRYGEQHNAVANQRNEMRQLQQAMLDELKRIQQTYRSEYEIAKSREASAEKALSDEFQRSGQSRVAQVKLRELEGVAQTARGLYENFMQRRMQAAQQQSLPITDARVITNATPPTGSSHPKTPIVLGIGLAAGLGTGIGIGFLRELLNRSIRSKRQLEQASGVPCLGLLPKVRTGAIRRSGKDRSLETRELVPRRHELAFVLRAPFSQFAEGIRSIKLSADLNLANADGGIIIGVVSSFPGEGKSTVSANLAFLAAQTGSRVLLIDCDMRNPMLTNGLAPQANTGLRQVLTVSSGHADECIWTHAATGAHFLPANTKESPENSSGLLNSPAMEQLLKTARSEYDYVILDFAPMLPVVDVRATANLVDGFVLVAEWAKTPRDAITEAVSLSSVVRAKILGAVLNKVDIKQMRRYGDYDGKCYSQYFERYFERAS